MSTALVTTEPLAGKALESFVVRGDLAALSPEDKAKHYLWVCERVGLDAATKPLEYIKLNGREVLYCKKEGTDQLRKIHAVAITITNRERIDDVYVVTARALMPDGRTDESQGAVTIGSLKGDALANAIMKAETKAKRRVTLSITGLSMLDESELDTIPQDKFAAVRELQAPLAGPPVHEKAHDLPPVPEKITTLPDSLLGGIPQLKAMALEGVSLDEMRVEQLEAVNEACGSFYSRYSKNPKASEHGLKWLRAIIADTGIRMGAANKGEQ